MDSITEETDESLDDNRSIGRFRGRMNFGPGALGSRSTLASPVHWDKLAKLNEVKDSEEVRLVAWEMIE